MINGSGAECFGRMTSISVEKQRKIMLQSPNGKKTFGYDVKFEDILAENLRGFVKIVSEKNRIKDISITNEFSIESFWTKDLPIKLLKPLSLKVFYEEGRYIVEEDVF
ncbi:MAG: hypothetical protein FWH46_04490, partial [Methanimicrococcus sp.]|nr:hypothetical protein [Methanimicrococcus sp.]